MAKDKHNLEAIAMVSDKVQSIKLKVMMAMKLSKEERPVILAISPGSELPFINIACISTCQASSISCNHILHTISIPEQF